MAQLTINTGSSAGAGDGDSLYTAFNKVNTNFTELYSKVTVLENGTIAVLGALKGTIVGDDSTILVDGVSSSINLDGTVKGNIIPDANEAYDIGSSSKRFKDLYLKGNTITLGSQTISSTASGISTSGTLSATAVTTTAPSTLSGTFTGDVTGSVFADDSTPIIDGVGGIVVGNVRNGLTTTGTLETNQISNGLLAPMLMTATDSGLVITNTNLSNPGAIPGSNLEIHSQNNAVEITGNSYVSIISGSAGGPYADMDIYGDVLTLNGGQVYYNHTNQAFSGTVDFSSATVTGTNFLTSYTETDPVVGAITGIVKADGAGNISAAVAGTDYLTTVAFSDLTGTPTTIAGYGITDAFDGDYNSLTNLPTIPTAYTDSDVDTHLNTGTASSGEVLSWTGSDYDWVAQSGGGTGDLTITGSTITAPADTDITLDPSGTGNVAIAGDLWPSVSFTHDLGDPFAQWRNIYGNQVYVGTTLNLNQSPGTSGQVVMSQGGGGAQTTWTDLKTVNGNSLLGSGDVVIAGGGASLPTVVNNQITHTLQDLIGFGAGSAAVTAFTTTVTPSSVTSPVFLTINLQASGRSGTGEFGLNLVLKQDGVDVPNSRRLFFVREMNVSYDGTNITYTHTWIPGTTSATLIELWAYNNGGAGGRIGNSLNPIGSISAIVW